MNNLTSFFSLTIYIGLIIVCSFCNLAFAQTYEPFIDTTKRWNMTRTIYNTQIYTYTARIKKIDTLIDGKVYQKIVSDTIYLLPENESAGYLGFIREDTTSKKVYYTNTDVGYSPFQFNTNEERLLYDFSLEIGDTATVMTTEECNNDGSGFTSLKVLNIDSLELIDGSKRKRWFLEDINNGDEVYWIEGIGSEFGLYMPSCPRTALHMFEYSLLCFFEDETHLYQQQNQTTCSVFWTSSTDELDMKENGFVVFPNPASDELNIELNKEITGKLVVYDAKGLEVLNKKFTGDNLKVNIESLSKGVYYLKINSLNLKAVNKIVKL